eukprot:gene3866-13929_t
MASLASWLKKGGHISSMEVSTAQPEMTGEGDKEALQNLAESLPRSCTSLQLSGCMAIPYMLLQASSCLTSVACLHYKALPGKWSYEAGMFPWPDNILEERPQDERQREKAEQGAGGITRHPEEEIQREKAEQIGGGMYGHPQDERQREKAEQVGGGMYGKAVYERNKPYWRSYERALDAVVHSHRHSLAELWIESPARCLSPHIVYSLVACPPSSLVTLKLGNFGGKTSNNPDSGYYLGTWSHALWVCTLKPAFVLESRSPGCRRWLYLRPACF